MSSYPSKIDSAKWRLFRCYGDICQNEDNISLTRVVVGNLSKRVKYGRYYYMEYFLVGFLTELCLYMIMDLGWDVYLHASIIDLQF